MLIEIRWKRKRLSHSSPLDELMRRPKKLRKSTAELLRTPVFLTAIGWKRYDCDNTEYLLTFLIAACSAGAPSLPRRRVHIGVRQSADSRYIPSQGFAGAPGH